MTRLKTSASENGALCVADTLSSCYSILKYIHKTMLTHINQPYDYQNTCTRTFLTAVFTIIKARNNQNAHQQLGYIYIMECYTALRIVYNYT